MIDILATALSIPQTLAALVELRDRLVGACSSEDDNSDQPTEEGNNRPQLESPARFIQDQCNEAEQAARSIPCQHQRERILTLVSGMKNIIPEISSSTSQVFITMCLELSNTVMDALQQALRSTASSEFGNSSEVERIRRRMINNSPVPSPLLADIYCQVMPPNFEDGDTFCNLEGQICFVEFFPFGANPRESKMIEIRICWMSLLVKSIKCPHLAETFKIHKKLQGQNRRGFYTFNRVHMFTGDLYTLHNRINRIRNKRRVLLALCSAVEEIHGQTILHKNICLHNVLVDEEDHAWLAGFSSSRLNDQNSYAIPREEEERFKMVYYASDDFSTHLRTFKCDIYAMGVTMLEIVLGMCFVDSLSVIQSREDIHHKLGAMNGPLVDLITNCLSKDARKRPFAYDVKTQIEFMGDDHINQSDLQP